MKIIKLDAIDSTNRFLKDMAENAALDNFTVIQAAYQYSGRGQRDTVWSSERGKNLIFSVFVRDLTLGVMSNKYLNFAISLSVYQTLLDFNVPKVAIKWPNDIVSGRKKICGILIENSIQGAEIRSSVIGVGLNINESFLEKPELNATSLKDILCKNLDVDEVLYRLLEHLKWFIGKLRKKEFKDLEKEYLEVLYKKNIPSMFRTLENVVFMGKIIGVSQEGKLLIELSDETIQEFGIKEVSFA